MSEVIQFPKRIASTSALINEFNLKAASMGLSVDCPADGLFNSDIAIIAEAPGEREVNGKSPLIGASGALLWTTLRAHGITRNDCYITNVSKRQVAFDADEKRAPLGKHEFDQWRELLNWELLQLPNLKIVVALGNFALKALTGHDGITSWRGSVIPLTLHNVGGSEGEQERSVHVVAAYNPALVLREPKNELIFRVDLSRVRRVREGRWKDYKITTHINPTFSDARDFIADLASTDRPIAYDIETMAGQTACIGFANNATEAMCIAFRDRNSHRYSIEEEQTLRQDIQALLLADRTKLIAQNNMFDASWLWFVDKIKVKPAYFDTMLAHHTLFPQMPHNLGYMCTQYTMHPYYKDEKDSWREGGNIDGFWDYNGKDCCITWSIAQAMEKELTKLNLADFFHNHVMKIQPHLIRMVVGGVKVDLSLKKQLTEELGNHVEQLRHRFHQTAQDATGLAGYEPNPNSPSQLSDLFFNKLRLVGRGSSTNEENRGRMYKDHRTPATARDMIDSLNVYKEEQKFFSTYVETAIDDDGRMRCEYKQTGVQKAPGRLSSSKVLWGHYDPNARKLIQHGMNLQNQPKRAYEMFVADEDYTFIYFDLSQAEARYVGWDAQISEWIDQFERARVDGSYDAHRALAASMFKVPYDEVPTDDEIDGKKTMRFIAKRCRHGLNYRMMPDRLASTTGLSMNEAQRAFELYHRLNPELRKWWRALEEEARTTRTLFNSYGRRLFIQGRMDDPETLESIVAFKPQSTIGDKVCRVIYQAESDDRWPKDCRLAMNIHDALIGLAPVSKAKTALSILKKYAEEPIMVKGNQLIIPADCGVAEAGEDGIRRWSTIKKVKDLVAAQ